MNKKNTNILTILCTLGLLVSCFLFYSLSNIFPSTEGPRKKSYEQEINDCTNFNELKGIMDRVLNLSEVSGEASDFMISFTSISLVIIIILFGMSLLFIIRIKKEVAMLNRSSFKELRSDQC